MAAAVSIRVWSPGHQAHLWGLLLLTPGAQKFGGPTRIVEISVVQLKKLSQITGGRPAAPHPQAGASR